MKLSDFLNDKERQDFDLYKTWLDYSKNTVSGTKKKFCLAYNITYGRFSKIENIYLCYEWKYFLQAYKDGKKTYEEVKEEFSIKYNLNGKRLANILSFYAARENLTLGQVETNEELIKIAEQREQRNKEFAEVVSSDVAKAVTQGLESKYSNCVISTPEAIEIRETAKKAILKHIYQGYKNITALYDENIMIALYNIQSTLIYIQNNLNNNFCENKDGDMSLERVNIGDTADSIHKLTSSLKELQVIRHKEEIFRHSGRTTESGNNNFLIINNNDRKGSKKSKKNEESGQEEMTPQFLQTVISNTLNNILPTSTPINASNFDSQAVNGILKDDL